MALFDGPIFAGLSGISFQSDEIPFTRGVTLRKTYAHVMAPFTVAFAPAEPGKAHPSPWKSALGGASFDVHAELVIPKDLAVGVTQIRVAWVIVATMRLFATPHATCPIVSSAPFSEGKSSADGVMELLPFEVEPRRLIFDDIIASTLDDYNLRWVGAHWGKIFDLITSRSEFRLAIEALDEFHFGRRPELTLVLLLSALEALVLGEGWELRFRLAALVATYLEPPGDARLAEHQRIKKLYDARSKAAHGHGSANTKILLDSYELLRKVVVKMVNENVVPTTKDFEARLFGCEPS